MKRIAECGSAANLRAWWATVSPEIRAEVIGRYADYHTPEQVADLNEFGACCFEAEDGQLYSMQVGRWPVPEPHPDFATCLNVNLRYSNALVAYKLLYQANVAGARSIAGRDGARLPA